jgi:hypothetical protein
VDYLAIVLIIAGIAYVTLKWYRGRNDGTGGPADLAAPSSDAPPVV